MLRCRTIKNYDLIIIHDFKAGTVIAVTDTEFSVSKPSVLTCHFFQFIQEKFNSYFETMCRCFFPYPTTFSKCDLRKLYLVDDS
jgi:hypothetical protein